MATAAKKAEKNQEAVRKLSLKPENRDCMDCIVKGTPNVVMDFGIFVCSFCSGIHRSHQFKAKGISMTNFKDSEVEFLATMGNDKARKIWRANWDPNKFPLPKAYDERAIKDFIRRTYVEKQWYNPNGAPEGVKAPVHEEEDTPKVQPISNIIKDPAPLEVKRKTSGAQALAPAPVKSAPKTTEAPLFGGFEEPVASSGFEPTFEASFEDDGFSSAQTVHAPAPQSVPQPAPAKKAASINIDDLFGPSTSAPVPTQAFQHTAPVSQPQGNPFDTSGFFGAPQQQTFQTGGAFAPTYPPQHQQYPPQYPPQQQYPPQYQQHAGGAYPAYPPTAYPPQPFGAPAGGNPFGAPQSNPFGAPTPFGAPAPAPSPFGAPAPAFGAAPSPFTGSPAMGTRPPSTTPAPAPATSAPVHDPFATLDVFSTVKSAPAPVRSSPAPAPAPAASKPATQSVDDLFSF